ncbi:lamin tail domain-containing protein [Methanocalculus sp.]|uniref:lamin tail domain-containing protein n=1 Tax=Methanocalculus sp. TaxID=2004547 RepID=UPI0026314FFC|nr:lamin tail domain-containing protein [Methanocalculus sp.]MDG6250920.1 lamin tail domain-containing protein [Methanocalculus sp.]
MEISGLSLGDEWVEITNLGSSSVSLNGWRIEDDGVTHTYTFSSFTLGPGASVKIHSGPDAKGMSDTSTDLYWTSQYVRNNDGDTAFLYDASGKLVDTC